MDMRPSKKCLLSLLFLIGLVEISTAIVPKPNIVLIWADDMSPYELGCYGQKKIQTPNIDHLAKEGMLFTDWLLEDQSPPHSFVHYRPVCIVVTPPFATTGSVADLPPRLLKVNGL